RRGPGVVRVDVARHAGDRGHAISFRSDVAVFQPRIDDGIDFLGLGLLELLLRFDLPEDGSSECDESKRDENATHLVHRGWGGGWGWQRRGVGEAGGGGGGGGGGSREG